MGRDIYTQTNPSTGRSLIRLFIGIVESWVYDLVNRMQNWETQIADDSQETQSIQSYQSELDNDSPYAKVEVDWSEPKQVEKSGDMLRYAAIGMLFDIQEQTNQNLKILKRGSKILLRLTEGVLSPLSTSSLLNPFRKKLNSLVVRGENEVNRWINIGRAEESHSRNLALKVQDDFINGWIKYLTGNEEIVGLVEMQSASLATEVVEEIRERTVSADSYLEGITRAMLHRVPRPALPEPPPQIRMRASPLHPKTTRSRKAGGNPQ